MSLEKKVMGDLVIAMKAKDDAALRGLRAIKAEIIKAKTEQGANGQISEDGEMKLLQKLVKQRKDSLEIYTQQNREDLAKTEKEEIAIIEKFLPQQLSAEEIKAALQTIIENSGVTSAADMGKVMGMASKELAGKADGKTISAILKEMLSNL